MNAAVDGPVLVIGAGQAAVQAAESLRAGGFTAPITLLGEEPHVPYHRPPLSKGWLLGEVAPAQLVLRAPEALARKGIALRTGVRVAAVDRDAQVVRLADGSALPYAGLVLATGSRPRTLAVPGAQLPGVLALRGRDEAETLAARLRDCAAHGWPLVVIGGGFIGLEVAASARKLGLAVTVVETAPRLLARVLPPLLSDWFARLHAAHGVTLALETGVECIAASEADAPLRVLLRDGRTLPAGAVLVGIGAEPDDALAREAGLACDRGIVVDACSRTADPHIVAAGDCTARRLPDGTLLRLESVQNAVEQAKCAAAALLGQPRPFTATPWFWSDQHGSKLQMAGLSAGADLHVVRGTLDAPAFSVCHFAQGRLVGMDSINAAREHLQARKLLDAGVSPTVAQAADTGFDLASLLHA